MAGRSCSTTVRATESWATLAPREIETGTRTVRAEAAIEVDAVTLDRYCEERDVERIDVLKIDVEGAEERVLSGAAGLFQRGAVDLVIVEVADTTLAAGGASANALVESLETHGLRTLAILDGELRPFRIAGEHLVLTNVVAASARARERLRRTWGSSASRRPRTVKKPQPQPCTGQVARLRAARASDLCRRRSENDSSRSLREEARRPPPESCTRCALNSGTGFPDGQREVEPAAWTPPPARAHGPPSTVPPGSSGSPYRPRPMCSAT